MVDNVVGVLLQGVVDAGLEVGLGAVVIDAQTAAHIQILQAGPGAGQIDIHAHGFVHGPFDLADVGNLAAQVKVQQVQTVGHAERLQLLERAHGFGSGEPELGPVASRRLPAARPAAGQLDAKSNGRAHAHALAVLQDQLQLRILFHHRDDLPAHFLGQHGHFNVFVVFEAMLLLLIAAGLSSKLSLRPSARLLAAGIFIATVGGVLLSQYLIWSIICGDVIEGVQGRYFLPVLPLALMSIHVRRIPRLPMSAVIAAGILANIIALGVLARQYWW